MSCHGRPQAMLAAGHSVLPLSFRYLVLFFLFSTPIISEVAWPIVNKLSTCLMVTQIYDSVRNLGGFFPENLAAQKHQNFGDISHNFAN